MVQPSGVRGRHLGELVAEAGVGPRGHREDAAGRRGSRDPQSDGAVGGVPPRIELRVAAVALALEHHRGVDFLTTAGVDPGTGPVVRTRTVGHHPHVVRAVGRLEHVPVGHVGAVAARLPAPAGGMCGDCKSNHRYQRESQRAKRPCKDLPAARHSLTSLLPFCSPPDEET